MPIVRLTLARLFLITVMVMLVIYVVDHFSHATAVVLTTLVVISTLCFLAWLQVDRRYR